jgi:hypothetical protein
LSMAGRIARKDRGAKSLVRETRRGTAPSTLL